MKKGNFINIFIISTFVTCFKICTNEFIVDNHNRRFVIGLCHVSDTVELYVKLLPKLQFLYSKSKVSTKLIYAPKQGKKKFGP